MQKPELITWLSKLRRGLNTTHPTKMLKEKILSIPFPQLTPIHAQKRWRLGESFQSLSSRYHCFGSLRYSRYRHAFVAPVINNWMRLSTIVRIIKTEICVIYQTDGQRERETKTDRQTGRQADRQANRMDRQSNRDRQADGCTDVQTVG